MRAGTLQSFRYLTKGEAFGALAAKLSAAEAPQVTSHADLGRAAIAGAVRSVPAGTPREPFIAAAVDADDASARAAEGMTIRVAAADGEGKPLPNAAISFEGLSVRRNFEIGPAVRREVMLGPSALPVQVVPRLFRFVVVVSWDNAAGGRPHRDLPVIMRR